MLGYLNFQLFKSLFCRSIICAADLSWWFVGHAEDKPTGGLSHQIGLVAQSGKVLTQFIKMIVVLGFFELDPLRFGWEV